MKKLQKIWSALLVALCVFACVGCSCVGCLGERVRIAELAATYAQSQTVYVGESADVLSERGTLSVFLRYTNGKSTELTVGYALSGSLDRAGEVPVRVEYAGYGAEIIVQVTQKEAVPVGISATYAQKEAVYTDYSVTDLDKYGTLVLHLNYSDGTFRTVDSGYTYSGTLTVGMAAVQVDYGGYSAEITVQVSERQAEAVPVGISATYAQKEAVYTDYSVSDLDQYGTLVLHLNYSDGTFRTVDSGYTYSGTLTQGVASVNVEYGGYRTQITVLVSERKQEEQTEVTPVGISATYTQKEAVYAHYAVSDLDQYGKLVLHLDYSDGTFRTVTSGYTYSGRLTVGMASVNVEYAGFACSITVMVLQSKDISYIVADYTQMDVIWMDSPLSEVENRGSLVVTAYYMDGSSGVVQSYELSGNLSNKGGNTVAVTYRDKTTTFIAEASDPFEALVTATYPLYTNYAVDYQCGTFTSTYYVTEDATYSPVLNGGYEWFEGSSNIAAANYEYTLLDSYTTGGVTYTNLPYIEYGTRYGTIQDYFNRFNLRRAFRPDYFTFEGVSGTVFTYRAKENSIPLWTMLTFCDLRPDYNGMLGYSALVKVDSATGQVSFELYQSGAIACTGYMYGAGRVSLSPLLDYLLYGNAIIPTHPSGEDVYHRYD